MIAVFDARKCPAQENICQPIRVCPQHAIRYQEDESLPLGGMMVIDAHLCNGCGLCVEACCGNAIIIT